LAKLSAEEQAKTGSKSLFGGKRKKEDELKARIAFYEDQLAAADKLMVESRQTWSSSSGMLLQKAQTAQTQVAPGLLGCFLSMAWK